VAKPDLRKLKDQAAKAAEKRHYDKAAELYLQIAELEADEPDWRQRAGEALKKTDDLPGAAAQFKLAAEGYAKAGFLLKAIAVCKVVLQIHPKHTATQTMLASLYAQRDSRPNLPQQAGLVRTDSGNFTVLPVQPPPPPIAAVAPPPAPPTLEPDPVPLGLELAALDEVAIPTGAPIDVVPLATVLNGKKSGQFRIVLPEEVDTPEIRPEASAYEITIDDLLGEDAPTFGEATPTLDPMQLRVDSPPVPQIPITRLDDELSFAGIAEQVTAAAPPTDLPKIPLLSSLTPDRLRHLIQRVEVRDVPAGETVVKEGERGGSLFVVVSGRVRVVIGEREVATLGDGDFFGEQAILTDFPRTATVQAVAPTQLLELSRSLVSELVAGAPDVLRTLLRFFRDRLLDRLLGASPLFSTMNPDDARLLSERFLFLELEPKMRVVREGERAAGLFLLLAGEAQVLKGQARIATLGPGDVFGEMSLLARGAAVATIATVTKCWALELPAKEFQEIMLSYPQVLAYVSELAERRAALNEHIELL
jgi:CRP-like cAMP-binding protein